MKIKSFVLSLFLLLLISPRVALAIGGALSAPPTAPPLSGPTGNALSAAGLNCPGSLSPSIPCANQAAGAQQACLAMGGAAADCVALAGTIQSDCIEANTSLGSGGIQ